MIRRYKHLNCCELNALPSLVSEKKSLTILHSHLFCVPGFWRLYSSITVVCLSTRVCGNVVSDSPVGVLGQFFGVLLDERHIREVGQRETIFSSLASEFHFEEGVLESTERPHTELLRVVQHLVGQLKKLDVDSLVDMALPPHTSSHDDVKEPTSLDFAVQSGVKVVRPILLEYEQLLHLWTRPYHRERRNAEDADVLDHLVGLAAPVEERLARQELDEDTPERPHVHRKRILHPKDDFRRAVIATLYVLVARLFDIASRPKVNDFDFGVLWVAQQNILRL